MKSILHRDKEFVHNASSVKEILASKNITFLEHYCFETDTSNILELLSFPILVYLLVTSNTITELYNLFLCCMHYALLYCFLLPAPSTMLYLVVEVDLLILMLKKNI